MKERIRPCKRCFNLTESEECDICTDPRRDPSVICAVEDPYDIGPIERTGEYRGLYHVLGGALSPLDGIEPEDLRIAELVERVGKEETKEIVVATNPNTTGEATALFIAQELEGTSVRVTALASGLPVAGSEYADEVTLGRRLRRGGGDLGTSGAIREFRLVRGLFARGPAPPLGRILWERTVATLPPRDATLVEPPEMPRDLARRSRPGANDSTRTNSSYERCGPGERHRRERRPRSASHCAIRSPPSRTLWRTLQQGALPLPDEGARPDQLQR